MEKIRQTWSEKQAYEKTLSGVGIICAVSVIILAFMQILSIWENAINVFEPLLGVIMLIQTILNWKKNKALAILSLCVAVFIFGIAIFILAIR